MKPRQRLRFFLAPVTVTALVLLVLPLPAKANALGDKPVSPRPWLKGMVDKAHALARQRIESDTPAEAKWRSQAKDLIDEMLDWPEMTEQALGRHWKALASADRSEFAKLLREMIETSYQSKLRMVARGKVKKPEQVKIEWLEEKIDGEESIVSARIKTEKNVAVLEFKLKWKNGRWRAYDVSIDDVSTVRTYRTQFGKIINQNGFPALLERMRTKTEEIRSGRAELTP